MLDVLSEGRGRKARLVKDREFASTASIQRHVMLEQSAAVASMFTRVDGSWTGAILGDDVTLDMPEIGIAIPLPSLYRGLGLSPEPGEEA